MDLHQQKSGNDRTSVTTGGAGVEVEWTTYAATGTLVLPPGAVQSALGQGFLIRCVEIHTIVNYIVTVSTTGLVPLPVIFMFKNKCVCVCAHIMFFWPHITKNASYIERVVM